jgi:hypothetical protein
MAQEDRRMAEQLRTMAEAGLDVNFASPPVDIRQGHPPMST